MPPWSKGDDAGPSTRKLRVRVPPGVLVVVWLWGSWPPRRLREPEIAGSTPAGQTLQRGRGVAVLASLMSSRPWVRIPPALSLGGVAQRESARLSGERPPVRVRSSPLVHGGCGVTAAPEVVSLAVPVRIRSAALLLRTLSTGELREAVTLSPRAVVVRLHPSALSHLPPGDVAQLDRAPRLQRGRCRFDSDRLHSSSLRSVNGKHAPFVRPRCGFDSCRRLSHARSSVDRALLCDGRGRWFDSSRACSSRT